ncbi:MAG TPA: HD domain-containing phosphohydrolase [Nitrospirota bacterium]|nr:HD domain-containing phosphohydrolase [Nitrospirota bacterium]
MLNEKQKLTTLIRLGIELTGVKDIDVLLEKILREARTLVNADAGSIYIREDDQLKFSYTQNDTLQKRLPPGKKLIYSTFSIPINSKSLSGHVAHTGETLNLPDVYELGPGLPYSFNKQYDNLSGYRTTSVLTFPLKTNRGDVIGVLQLINGKDGRGKVVAFKKSDEPLILNFANTAAVAIERAQMTRAMILRMIKMAELRDPKETGAHVNRVASYAVTIYENWATRRGIAQEEIEKNRDVLRMAAMLHDVGKVAISDSILKKPDRFTPEEYEIMKRHTYLGARLFSELYSDFDDAASVVALNHHEYFDGGGYPGYINVLDGTPLPGRMDNTGIARGKRGEEIPVFGRVVAIADVYDALSSRRVYKEAWDESRVLETIRTVAGKQFDPEMIDAFFCCLDTIHSITERYPDH